MNMETWFVIVKVNILDTRLECIELTLWYRFNVVHVFSAPCITGTPYKFDTILRRMNVDDIW